MKLFVSIFSAATVILFSGTVSGAASDYSCRIQCSGGYVVAGVVRAYSSSEAERKIIEQIKSESVANQICQREGSGSASPYVMTSILCKAI